MPYSKNLSNQEQIFATYVTWRGLFGKIKNYKLGKNNQRVNGQTQERNRLFLEEEARNNDIYL